MLLFLLGLGLPLHGGITVFLPDVFRWWKEFVLICVGVILLSHSKSCWLQLKKVTWRSPVVWASLFCAWSLLLAVFNSDLVTALVATRYLVLGYGVFVAIWGISQVYKQVDVDRMWKKFSTGLLTGSIVSVLFGVWAQFLGGFKVLASWYANTISSWVPGQTLPIYHQTSEGLIRMQGLSSGPVEFGHVLLLAFYLVNREQGTGNKFLGLLLFFGIVMSGSRAALLGAVLVIIVAVAQYLNTKINLFHRSVAVNVICVLVMMISFLVGAKYVVSELPESMLKKVVRVSDSDHITRPIKAFKIGMTRPIVGNLGKLGPAARAKNLKLHNNDQAPIAENVFIDYFAQLGILGLFLSLMFWGTWVYESREFVLGSMLVLLMNLATILDMTPLAILMFVILAFRLYFTTKSTHA